MTDLSTAPIREIIESLRKKPKDGSTNPMRDMLSQLVFGALATRLEKQANEIEVLETVYEASIALDGTFNIGRCFEGDEVNEWLAALAAVEEGKG